MDNQNLAWASPEKPTELAENRLIDAILSGRFAIGTSLPAERELAIMLGVTRPTLREVLQRLARDGWIEIRHGKSTRVRDYWHEGSLAVLGAIVRRPAHLPEDFVANLLAVRYLLAPEYTRLAVEKAPGQTAATLAGCLDLPDEPQAFASADWNLHHHLTTASGNPIFTLILNGFCDFYQEMAIIYFTPSTARDHSRRYYQALHSATLQPDPAAAEELTQRVMKESMRLWEEARRNT